MECDASFWLEHFNKLGLPIVLLLTIFYSIWGFFKWAAPRFDGWLTKHFEIESHKARTLEESSQKCAQTQAENVLAIRALTDFLKETGRNV